MVEIAREHSEHSTHNTDGLKNDMETTDSNIDILAKKEKA